MTQPVPPIPAHGGGIESDNEARGGTTKLFTTTTTNFITNLQQHS